MDTLKLGEGMMTIDLTKSAWQIECAYFLIGKGWRRKTFTASSEEAAWDNANAFQARMEETGNVSEWRWQEAVEITG